MRFDDPAIRAAYRRGARDAFESSVVGLQAAEHRAVEAWLVELDAWSEGEPPRPPYDWLAD